uniref:Uncharacterized protein MANES_13G105300 n=1 Tax=Rhizophora mucronata TaxID=61149 RepID=A0A2P2L1E9_RHIMU
MEAVQGSSAEYFVLKQTTRSCS